MKSFKTQVKPEKLGLIWYTQETFEWAKSAMKDGHTFPSFTEWLQRSQSAEQLIKRDGVQVVRVHIDPQTFPAWCAANGHDVNTNGRQAFAAWSASKDN